MKHASTKKQEHDTPELSPDSVFNVPQGKPEALTLPRQMSRPAIGLMHCGWAIWFHRRFMDSRGSSRQPVGVGEIWTLQSKTCSPPDIEALENKTQSPDCILRRYKGNLVTTRSAIFLTLDDPGFSKMSARLSIFTIGLILLVTATYVLESEATVADGAVDESAKPVFESIELAAVTVFTIEYLARLITCPIYKPIGCLRSTLRFVMAPFNLIDAAACFPYWVTFTMKLHDPDADQTALGFVRAMRLIRVFRICRIAKYSTGIQMIVAAMTRSTRLLGILIMLLCISVLLIGSIMNMVEGDVALPNSSSYSEAALNAMGRTPEAHLACYGTITRCFWWAIVTMTTVGYGDCYPVTGLGKMISSVAMLSGVLILALPITVVGANFQAVVDMHEADLAARREAATVDESGDGIIDLLELRTFLIGKRKLNVLRRDIPTDPEALLAQFDVERKGHLYLDEFKKLEEHVIEPLSVDPQASTRTLLQAVKTNELRFAEVQEAVRQMEIRFEAGMARIESLINAGGCSRRVSPISAGGAVLGGATLGGATLGGATFLGGATLGGRGSGRRHRRRCQTDIVVDVAALA